MTTDITLYADRKNGIEFGNPTEASTEFLKKVGITSSTCSQKLDNIFIASEYYEQLNAFDQKKCRSTGQRLINGKDQNGSEYWVMIFPNGAIRIERAYGYRPVWFQNNDYSPLIQKPVKPEDCNASKCERGWIYNMGTAYPCSKCTAQEDYRLKIKLWESQQTA